LIDQPAWADKGYVTDSFTVTLRTGPSGQNKIVSMLPSGISVEILDSQDNWSNVRILEGREKDKEGWIFSRYLITRVPWEVQATYFKKENKALKEKLAGSEKERDESVNLVSELSKKLKVSTGDLQKTQREYGSLKKGATGYIQLKAKYDSMESALKTNQDAVQMLTMENEKLKSSKRSSWLATGAMILLCGLVIGLIMGRQQKKRKSMLYP